MVFGVARAALVTSRYHGILRAGFDTTFLGTWHRASHTYAIRAIVAFASDSLNLLN